MTLDVVGLIPARGGSKGIPRKNLADLGGKPLIAWSIEAALAAQKLTGVLVSTDDAEIAEVARALGADVPFLRPASLANDTAPALGVVAHALAQLETAGERPEAIAYLQPTSPFRSASHIDSAVDVLLSLAADTVVSVVPVPHNMRPQSLMQVESSGLLRFAVPPEQRQFRRQEKGAAPMARNGPAILLNRSAVILSGQLYGARIAPLEMDHLHSVDIDEPADLEIARRLLPLVQSDMRLGGTSTNGRIPN